MASRDPFNMIIVKDNLSQLEKDMMDNFVNNKITRNRMHNIMLTSNFIKQSFSYMKLSTLKYDNTIFIQLFLYPIYIDNGMYSPGLYWYGKLDATKINYIKITSDISNYKTAISKLNNSDDIHLKIGQFPQFTLKLAASKADVIDFLNAQLMYVEKLRVQLILNSVALEKIEL